MDIEGIDVVFYHADDLTESLAWYPGSRAGAPRLRRYT
jgi:hypothetical protein